VLQCGRGLSAATLLRLPGRKRSRGEAFAPSGELVVTELHGKYYEQTWRGNLFHATIDTVVGADTTLIEIASVTCEEIAA
jgi:hypothetical protein